MSDESHETGATRAPRPGRMPYARPQIRRIRLTADEVLAKGCKTTPPSGGYQGTGCLHGGCFNNGS